MPMTKESQACDKLKRIPFLSHCVTSMEDEIYVYDLFKFFFISVATLNKKNSLIKELLYICLYQANQSIHLFLICMKNSKVKLKSQTITKNQLVSN